LPHAPVRRATPWPPSDRKTTRTGGCTAEFPCGVSRCVVSSTPDGRDRLPILDLDKDEYEGLLRRGVADKVNETTSSGIAIVTLAAKQIIRERAMYYASI
jgi:hypothetical protein